MKFIYRENFYVPYVGLISRGDLAVKIQLAYVLIDHMVLVQALEAFDKNKGISSP